MSEEDNERIAQRCCPIASGSAIGPQGLNEAPHGAFHQQGRQLNLQEPRFSISGMAKSLTAGEHFPFTIF